jgi:hypothetical protein
MVKIDKMLSMRIVDRGTRRSCFVLGVLLYRATGEYARFQDPQGLGSIQI